MQSPEKIAKGSKSWSTQGTDRLHPLHFSATEIKRAEGAGPEIPLGRGIQSPGQL